MRLVSILCIEKRCLIAIGLVFVFAEYNLSLAATIPQTAVVDGDQQHQQVNPACNTSGVYEDKVGNEYFKIEESELHGRCGTSSCLNIKQIINFADLNFVLIFKFSMSICFVFLLTGASRLANFVLFRGQRGARPS